MAMPELKDECPLRAHLSDVKPAPLGLEPKMLLSAMDLLNQSICEKLDVSPAVSLLPVFTICNILIIPPLWLLLVCPFYKNSISFLFTTLSEIGPLSCVCSDDEDGQGRVAQVLCVQKCHRHRVLFGRQSTCSKLCSY